MARHSDPRFNGIRLNDVTYQEAQPMSENAEAPVKTGWQAAFQL